MWKLIKKQPLFFSLFLTYLILGAYWLLNQEKGGFVLWLNARHTPFWDGFFKYFTFLGDGIFFGIIVLVFLMYRYYYALMGLVTFLTSGVLFSQVLKKTIFRSFPRPKGYFGEDFPLNYVEGVTAHAHQSFPSGHTATAFALFCMLSLMVKNKAWGVLFFICAWLVAVSRSYLILHFFIDTYFGAIIGVLCGLLTFYFFEKSNLSQNPKWQRGMLSKKDKS